MSVKIIIVIPNTRYGMTLALTVVSLLMSRLPSQIAVLALAKIATTPSTNSILNEKVADEGGGYSTKMMAASGESLFQGHRSFEDNDYWWAGQLVLNLPVFLCSAANPWIYAYHNLDLKPCMHRIIRRVLVALKFISKAR